MSNRDPRLVPIAGSSRHHSHSSSSITFLAQKAEEKEKRSTLQSAIAPGYPSLALSQTSEEVVAAPRLATAEHSAWEQEQQCSKSHYWWLDPSINPTITIQRARQYPTRRHCAGSNCESTQPDIKKSSTSGFGRESSSSRQSVLGGQQNYETGETNTTINDMELQKVRSQADRKHSLELPRMPNPMEIEKHVTQCQADREAKERGGQGQ